MADISGIQDLKKRAVANINDIIPLVAQMIEEAYSRGYDEGLVAGKQEAGQTLLKFIADMNTDHILPIEPGSVTVEGPSARMVVTRNRNPNKQPPGTVKPAILKVIQDCPNGLTIRDIEQKTGFKHNSIRGTVWLLQKEGTVKKGDGNLWIPASPSRQSNQEFEDVLGPSDAVRPHADGGQEGKSAPPLFD